MKKREHSETSKAAHEFIKPHKPNHIERIVEALKKLKTGGTFESIAACAGMRDDQVWRRLSEAEKAGIIFNTGTTRKLKSGCSGSVWQLTDLSQIPETKPSDISFTPTENIQEWFNGYQNGKEEPRKISEQQTLF